MEPPTDNPETRPVKELIVAIAGLEEDQVPGGETVVKMILLPVQMDAGPLIGPGSGLTVKDVAVPQPVARMYEIVVVPAPTPSTTPAGLIVATEGIADTQEPPPEVVLRFTEFPTQTEEGPEMLEGNGLTVMD